MTSALRAVVTKVVQSQRFSDRVALLGLEAETSTPNRFKAFLIVEVGRLRQVIHETKIVVR